MSTDPVALFQRGCLTYDEAFRQGAAPELLDEVVRELPHTCDCAEPSIDHPEGPCTNITTKRFNRQGTHLWLCDWCVMGKDREA